MFGKIIGLVLGTGLPINVELILGGTATKPIELHVNSFQAFLFDSVVGNAGGCIIVCLERGGWLRMAQLMNFVGIALAP